MTPEAKAKMEQMALKHQNGMDEDNHYTNDKVPGLIAYHKFIAGFTAGYAARDEETHGGIARELTEISPRELTLIKALRFYARGKTSDDGEVGERREFGCGCCAGVLKAEGDYTFTDYDADVIGLTARQTLSDLGIPLKEGE